MSDFASRRLDARFVDTWDSWVSAGLARLRADDGEHWTDAYLTAPTWRFFLGPGFLPSPFHTSSWTGVVMPSVDRVGRYYPLTLTAPVHERSLGTAAQGALWGWLQRLEDIAVGALDADWSIDALEAELFRLGLPLAGGSQLPASGGGSTAIDAAAEFFAPVHPPSCMWRSEVDGISHVFRSGGLDESICRLWAR